MFENPRRGRQAKHFTTNVPKILDFKSSSKKIFSENWRWVPLVFVLLCSFMKKKTGSVFPAFCHATFHHALITCCNVYRAGVRCLIGSFSNDDGDGNENGKKTIGLISKTTTLHVHHTFLYISLPSLHDYDAKMPTFTIYGERKQATTNFLFSF